MAEDLKSILSEIMIYMVIMEIMEFEKQDWEEPTFIKHSVRFNSDKDLGLAIEIRADGWHIFTNKGGVIAKGESPADLSAYLVNKMAPEQGAEFIIKMMKKLG